VIEEQLLRGYVLRLLLQWQSERADAPTGALRRALDQRSLFSVPPGGWSALAVVGSSVAFALGHRVVEWPAALAYGLLMAALWIVRGDLLSCVVAHAVTNLALALVAAGSGRWELW
jgi:membrane protease YdiL (CAAX protease family)